MLTFYLKTASLLVMVLLLLSGCSSSRPISDSATVNNRFAEPFRNYQADKTMAEEDLLFSLLRNEYLYWQGTPYRLGGNDKKGIDCSALVQAIYKNSFNISLSRTTNKQVASGFFVYRDALKVADLVFFKIGRKYRHVGIYIGDKQFLHASTSRGVMISSLDNVYWQSKYWQSRRILD